MKTEIYKYKNLIQNFMSGKVIGVAIFLILAGIGLHGKAQTYMLCPGSTVALTAINSLSLSSPSYSIIPGGITSPNPTFVVAPSSNTTYTLYVTGTNTNSAIVTSQNTVGVFLMGSPTYSLSSPNAFTLGCGSTSVCTINIVGAATSPTPGGAVSYTLLPPGSSTAVSAFTLGSLSSYTVNSPGTWSVVVKDNINYCTTWTAVNITLNNTPPVIGSISASQNPLTCSNPTTLVQVVPNSAVQYTWLRPAIPPSIQGNSIAVASNPTSPTQSIVMTVTLVAMDINNTCQSTTVIPIYQNLYPPHANIIPGNTLASCTHTITLTNASATGIPLAAAFPTNQAVIGFLWEGPSPQIPLSLSTTYSAQTTGVYSMTAKDLNNGCTSMATATVIVGPLAAFVHTVTGGQAVFNDVSTDTAPNTTYFWDFGDGYSSTQQNPTHTYLNGGAHFVKFKIMSPSGAPGIFCTDSVIQSVNVSGIPCVANSNFTLVAPTNTNVGWTIVPSYPWNVSIAKWSWGDGSTSGTLYTSHQYSATGMYNICLSVTVSCGDTSTTCNTYSVYGQSQPSPGIALNVVAPKTIPTGLKATQTNTPLSWNIIPNPNNGEFKLNLNTANYETARVIITDLTGRIVHDQSFEADSDQSVHTENLSPGMYLVTLKTDTQKYTKRMVVNR